MSELPPSLKKWADSRLVAVEHMPNRAWATTKTLYLDYVKWSQGNQLGLIQQAEFTRWLGNIEGVTVKRRAAGNTVLNVTLPEFLYAFPDWPSKPFVARLERTAPKMTKTEHRRGYSARPLDVAMSALSVIAGINRDAEDGLHRAQVIASEALRAITGEK